MKTAIFLLFAAAFLPTCAAAAPPDGKEILLLAPNVRIEQRCNAKAMGVIGREHHELHPDELVAYAFADTVIKGDTIRAPGAAVRSGGKWFRLSYTCETKDEGVDVVTFQYSLGAVVPREDWDAHYLVP
ncbi:DUF930 domain-containing protein [Aquabacter sp. CN5-332]|uniref:DUF930 domain-containing protein n=1 Tax=Aquabacter sp. CN5-332 TaxID=3156608 RepID=UPI0032B5C204